MKHKVLLLLTVIFAFVLVAVSPLETEAAGAVKLNKTKVLLTADQIYQLELKNTKKKVKWSTSDKSVVKINKNGKITAAAVGSAKITAKANGKKYTCKVTVADYSGMSVEQKDVVSYALKYVGNKYRYGGSSLTKGTDCSGFTMAVYKKFGYNLTHNAYSQMKETKSIKMKNIKPGDLIFYGASKRSCSHVALYIGNQKVVHASNPTNGILISDYDYRKAVGVGRVLKKATYPEPETPGSDTETPDVNGDITRTAAAK